MRYHTIIFQTEFCKHKKCIKKKLTDKLEELNMAIKFNTDEIECIETELQQINDQQLQEQAIFSRTLL